ncbi:MAG: translation initiation factor [Thermoproteota archaeon]|nr:translation initiation factor [Thermoproteota archaeon]
MTPTGKKKVITEEEIRQQRLPSEGEILGIVIQLLGYDRIMVKCADGNTRLCRIRGQMKRRVWIKSGDTVLVAPWDFQADKRGDIVWRYTQSQAEELKSKGYLTL